MISIGNLKPVEMQAVYHLDTTDKAESHMIFPTSANIGRCDIGYCFVNFAGTSIEVKSCPEANLPRGYGSVGMEHTPVFINSCIA